MKFRLCEESDYRPLRKLWGRCFGDEEPWTSWFFSEHYRVENTWVGEMDGVVMAQAHLLPHRLMLRGHWRETAFFVGVCVDEALRGKGYGRELMGTALEELRRRGVAISILQPRYPDFYRKLGWGFCYDRQAYRLPLSVASLLLPDPPADLECTEGGAEHLPFLYEMFTRLRHGYTLRGREDWDILLKDHRGEGGSIAIARKEGKPCGYVLYNTTHGLLYIRELVWLESPVTDALLKYLAVRGKSFGLENMEWLDPAGDLVSVLSSVSEPEPFLMGRIHNLQAWAAEIEYPAELAADLEIRITDPLAAWNDGRFRWSIKDGRGCMSPSAVTTAPELDMGIDSLSQKYFGYRGAGGPDPAADLIMNEATAAMLEKLFPPCSNYISEYF